jgi:predicted small integral membrane protein
MTSMTLETRGTVGGQLLHTIRTTSPALWWSIVGMLVGTVVCLGLQHVDPRLVNGSNTWIKPAKFFASLAIQFGTVAWALQFLPDTDRDARGVRWSIAAMVIASWAELAYIVFRASRAEASHFNTGTPEAAMLYSIMGIGAVTLTLTAGYIGWRIWRRRDGLWAEAAALGLMFGALLGTVAGGYLSAQSGHSVGGDPTDATGTGFFGWSTTGGDLRIAHFVGLHASQIIPLAALTLRRDVVWLATAFCILVTIGTFAVAIAGIPLFEV